MPLYQCQGKTYRMYLTHDEFGYCFRSLAQFSRRGPPTRSSAMLQISLGVWNLERKQSEITAGPTQGYVHSLDYVYGDQLSARTTGRQSLLLIYGLRGQQSIGSSVLRTWSRLKWLPPSTQRFNTPMLRLNRSRKTAVRFS